MKRIFDSNRLEDFYYCQLKLRLVKRANHPVNTINMVKTVHFLNEKRLLLLPIIGFAR